MKVGLKRGILLGVAFIVLSAALYFTFKPQTCLTEECFQRNMERCSSANYINDDSQATWEYEIKGMKDGECEIGVTLLIVKEGELNVGKLEGYSMSCFYPRGVVSNPEGNLDVCHGRLKEEIQKIIIERLHGYVLSNLDEVKAKLLES